MVRIAPTGKNVDRKTEKILKTITKVFFRLFDQYLSPVDAILTKLLGSKDISIDLIVLSGVQ